MLHQIFTWFDFVILALVLVSVVFGTMKGLLREVVSLISLFLSVVLAFRLAVPMSAYIPWWQSDVARYVVAFIAIAVLVLVVGMLIGIMLKDVAKRLGLGGLDHGLGAVFGFIRGSLMALVVVFLVSNTVVAKSTWYQDSYTKPVFHSAVVWLDSFSPDKLHHLSQSKLNKNQKKHLQGISHHVKHFNKMVTKD